MKEKQKQEILELCKQHNCVKLCYFFGSQARGEAGPASDFDFAIYLDEQDKIKRFDIRTKFIGEITKILKTDKVDVVVINDIKMPALKFQIITEGILLFSKEPFQVLIEPRIQNEYFDFQKQLSKNYEK